MIYKVWANDGYDSWGFNIEAESFEEALEKNGGWHAAWVSITDGVETRENPNPCFGIIP